MDNQKQVDYWRSGSDDDMESAEILLEKKKIQQALFFCHLALEKILKALFTHNTGQVPPKTHNLVLLAEKAGLHAPPERMNFLRKFNVWQLEGRYPDTGQASLNLTSGRERLEAAKEALNWLKTKF
ncbi:MAG TPA: HEPN domain-containing protein [bacterium]|nr:HEPN domain-containing protein [bacterium]